MHSPKSRQPVSAPAPVTPERSPKVKSAGSPVPGKKLNPFMSGAPKSPAHPGVKEVYQLVNKATGSIGGNADGGTIYGEISEGSMQKVLNILRDSCDMNEASSFIDIGAGLGKPNFHAAQLKVLLSIGVELNTIRHQLSMQNLTRVVNTASDAVNVTGVNFLDTDITKAKSLNPFTHIYQFDLGFEPPLHHYIADMFNASASCRYLISYRRPLEIMKYGYKVTHLPENDLPTSMCGSGEGHTCYFYKKDCSDEVKEVEKKIPTGKSKNKVQPLAKGKGKIGGRTKVALKFTAKANEVSSDEEEGEGEETDSSDNESISEEPATNDTPLVTIHLPATKCVGELTSIQSDPLWAKDIEISLCRDKLAQYCKEFNEKYFSSARPQRTSSRSPVRYSETQQQQQQPKGKTATSAETALKKNSSSLMPPRSPIRSKSTAEATTTVVTPNTTPTRSRRASAKNNATTVVEDDASSTSAKSPKRGSSTPKRTAATKSVALVF